VAVLGFFALVVVVVVLGTSSTARYEFDRNRVREQEEPAGSARVSGPAVGSASAAGGAAGGSSAAGGAAAGGSVAGGTAVAARDAEARQELALDVAEHPVGELPPGSAAALGWWLVSGPDDEAGDDEPVRPGAAEIVAGPFPDRTEADWAALANGLHAVAVYGAQGPGRRLVLRPDPQERAWLSELGDQLDRLPADWDSLLTDTDPLTTLVVEVAAALLEAGLALHDCEGAGGSAAGGVCLTPQPASGGILVSWHQHDRMSVQQVRGGYLDAAVQLTMNAAVADVLTHMGFAVAPFGTTGCTLVTAGER
jgi:hypothetical protein